MIKRFIDWLTRDDEYDKRLKELVDQRNEFVKSLTDRQLVYYYSLKESLPKAIVRLESRIHDLENKE